MSILIVKRMDIKKNKGIREEHTKQTKLTDISKVHNNIRKSLNRCYELRQQNYVWRNFPGYFN